MAFAWIAVLFLALLLQHAPFISWKLSSDSPAIPQSIDPWEVQARLNTTPSEYKSSTRDYGMVYFCHGENWGPPCFKYRPELNYTCSALGSELSGHVGSVFLEPGIICRLSTLTSNDRCAPMKIFAWPETESGWPDLFQRRVPGGDGFLGYVTTHFTCARCTSCIRDP
ncbi:hypothetical protein BGZ63DRAFT_397704 [Mariannaea sp. PMI_226]|nr:hypothetical protein BGZ63DRAFT_397704 [Mariannaea sp. PMI_226]